jgi:predicted nucleotidyltransferase
MNRRDVIALLKNAEPALKAHGIAALFLFGSYARDEARPDSDIDLLAEVADTAHLTLRDMLDAQAVIEAEVPDTEIFLVTRDEIVPFYLPDIDDSKLKIF